MNIKTLHESLDTLRELKEQHRLAKRAATEAENKLNSFQAELSAILKDEGLDSHSYGGYSYVPKSTVFGKVNGPEAFYAWCEENNMVDEFFTDKPVGERVHSIVRDRLDSQQDLPPGVSFYNREYISVTKKGG